MTVIPRAEDDADGSGAQLGDQSAWQEVAMSPRLVLLDSSDVLMRDRTFLQNQPVLD